MKKTLKMLLIALLVVPCAVLMAACGGTADIQEGTYLPETVKVDGQVVTSGATYDKMMGYTVTVAAGKLKLASTAASVEFEYKQEGNKILMKLDEQWKDSSFTVQGSDLIYTITSSASNVVVTFKKS